MRSERGASSPQRARIYGLRPLASFREGAPCVLTEDRTAGPFSRGAPSLKPARWQEHQRRSCPLISAEKKVSVLPHKNRRLNSASISAR